MKELDAVIVGADILELALGAVGLRIALEMAMEANHLAFQERRAATFTGPLDDFTGRFVDGEEVGSVDGDSGQTEAGCAIDIESDATAHSTEVDSA